MEFTAPQLASVVMVAKSAELAMPKRISLPSMLPPDCIAADVLIDRRSRASGLPRASAAVSNGNSNEKESGHRRPDRPAVARRSGHAAERVGEPAGIAKIKIISRKFVNGVGFSNG